MAIEAQRLVGKWTHSREEDHQGEMVFRPSSFRFPLSRGRRSVDLQADGRLIESHPGPDDRSAQAAGDWRLAGDRLTLVDAGGATSNYKIVSLDGDRLVLRPEN